MALKYNNDLKGTSPLSVILKFDIFKSGEALAFHYSRYINGMPGSGKSEYRHKSKIADINTFYGELENIINNLTVREELAIHSTVHKQQVKYHMPQIDFAISAEDHLFEKMSRLQEVYNYDIYLFKTGRSYHGYLDTLLTETEWRKFLGHLLLLNDVNEFFIDPRWIGHSAVHGFSSLRLSCNTPLYLSYPILWQKLPKRVVDDTKIVELELFTT